MTNYDAGCEVSICLSLVVELTFRQFSSVSADQ